MEGCLEADFDTPHYQRDNEGGYLRGWRRWTPHSRPLDREPSASLDDGFQLLNKSLRAREAGGGREDRLPRSAAERTVRHEKLRGNVRGCEAIPTFAPRRVSYRFLVTARLNSVGTDLPHITVTGNTLTVHNRKWLFEHCPPGQLASVVAAVLAPCARATAARAR